MLKLAKWVGGEGKVIAIEPESRNLKELHRYVEQSKLSGRIEIVEAAATDSDGENKLEINKFNPGDHRIGSSGRPVKSLTIDTIMKSFSDRRLSVIKMDVQGR